MKQNEVFSKIIRTFIVLNLLFIVGVGISSSFMNISEQALPENRWIDNVTLDLEMPQYMSNSITPSIDKSGGDYTKIKNGDIFLLPPRNLQNEKEFLKLAEEYSETDAEIELETGLEDWMIDDNHFDNEEEDEYQIEDWMLDTNYFKDENTDELFIEKCEFNEDFFDINWEEVFNLKENSNDQLFEIGILLSLSILIH